MLSRFKDHSKDHLQGSRSQAISRTNKPLFWWALLLHVTPLTAEGEVMITSKSLIALVVCILAFTSVALAKTQHFTTINFPDALNTYALGINPAGDIVGAYVDTGGEHGFLLRNGEFTSFDWPGANWTEGYGINPRGDIVGQYGSFDGVAYTTHGFLLRDGEFYPVDVEGQQNTMPFKISPEGMIVGCNHHNNSLGGTDLNSMVGFSLDAGGAISQTRIRSMNTGVNPGGDVVGYYFGTSTGTPSLRAEWSYLIRDGEMTLFQFPGSFATLATDISPTGIIVGRYRATSQVPAIFHGFVMEGGELESLDVPGAAQTFPFSISATGDIVGYFLDSTKSYHGFLLSRRSE